MRPVSLFMRLPDSVRRLSLLGLLALLSWVPMTTGPIAHAQAQGAEDSRPVQQITGRLEEGAATEVYRLEGLRAGDTLYATMQATSGNLDPILAILDGAADYAAVEATYQAELQQLIMGDGVADIALGLNQLRDNTFLVWDDDGGEGYGAALEFPIPASGDYYLIASSALTGAGRLTAGDYSLLLGLNEPGVLDGSARPTGAAIAALDPLLLNVVPRASEVPGVLTPEEPTVILELVDIDPGDTLYVYIDSLDSTLRPAVILRDFGDKPVTSANLGGQEATATLTHQLEEEGVGYTLEIRAVPGSDGQPTTGEFRAVVGLNTPEVLSGQISDGARPALKSPIEVQVGIKVDRISQVDSAEEDFTVIGSIRLDWRDPDLAFSPDTCDCDIKLYTEKEFDRFLADARSRWPDFSFFNQRGNRWIQSRGVAVWPDGRARYTEQFTTIFQADFDFQKFPFDTQNFPIVVEMLLPTNVYTLVDMPDYSAIDPDHGEDEFIIGEFVRTPSTLVNNATADRPISRMTFSFEAPRHLEYYMLQVFVPILLIVAISWFTFFLKDYTRRIEASAANILLFIAFSFSLADNYPRLGYLTFLDALMAGAFIVNALVLLYNVQMKRMEQNGDIVRVERLDDFFDWAYPLFYLAWIGLAAYFFLWRG